MSTPLSLSTLPPSTRAVLTNSSSSPITGGGPISSPTSSIGSLSSPALQNQALLPTHSNDNDGRTPRPGTSLVNMKGNISGANEHFAHHEHHSYGTSLSSNSSNMPSPSGFSPEDGDEAGYRSYRTPSNLRSSRSGYGIGGDAYGVGSQHVLHSKSSNLSTNTFMPPAKGGKGGTDEAEPLPSSLMPSSATPTTATSSPYNINPIYSLPTSTPLSPGTDGGTTPTVAQNPAVLRAKGSLQNTSTSSPQSSRGSKSRSTRDRERDRENTADISRRPKIRTIPHLPHGSAEPAPPTLMYWSRAPVYGHLPTRAMRAHSVTLVDNIAWLFGGCDEKGCARDVWCCDVETFQWTHPTLTGDIPPPCRAHTATLIDRRIFIFGGGEGPTYYNSLYILDTVSKKFTSVPCGQKPNVTNNTEQNSGAVASQGSSQSGATPLGSSPPRTSSVPPVPGSATPLNSGMAAAQANGPQAQAGGKEAASANSPPMPLARRAHTAVIYRQKLYIFGGGNGLKALNDVWSLDTSASIEKMRWEQVNTVGRKPGPRGYHTANLVGNIMIVVGGSDGRDCFSDIWVLNLDTLVWTLVDTEKEFKRLSHSSTQVGSYLFIMGGHDGLKYTNELLLFNLVTLQFEHKVTLGRPPPARGYHISLLADARLFVFGGFDGHVVFDDVWLLDLAGAAYLPQVTSFALLIDGGN